VACARGIAEGYRQALKRGYEHCGRLDADGQHLAAELKRMLELVASDECDVAVGSRFLPESGTDGEPYKPSADRVVGSATTSTASAACCSGSL
jgi:hypothetical protein